MINLLILVVAGFALFYPPKKINPWAGFRTRLAMSSQALWNESNRYAALLFIKMGLISMAFGLVFLALDLADYLWVVPTVTIVFYAR